MYAVIETGGKQYKVSKGDVIDVEKLAATEGDDQKVTFDRVLMVSGESVQIGNPTVAGAQVSAVRVDEVRGPKMIIFKMKRRKGYRRKNGHRQNYTRVRVEDIVTGA